MFPIPGCNDLLEHHIIDKEHRLGDRDNNNVRDRDIEVLPRVSLRLWAGVDHLVLTRFLLYFLVLLPHGG